MTHLKRWALLPALALILAACGSTSSTTTIVQSATPQQHTAETAPVPATTRAQVSAPCPSPSGEGVLGACTPKPVQVFGTKIVPVDPPALASIPDVSSYQGFVNWRAVKSWQVSHHFTPGGIFKMGEYVLDPYAAHNNAYLRSLGMWRAGYWFVRNTGCGYEGQQIVSDARALGLKIVMLDVEVPEARGYDGCLTRTLKQAGLIVVEYASPGSYPGGTRSDNPADIAAYGPSNPPAAPWGGPIKGFQCTDGVFGCVTYIPGIGRGDVSVDYGLTRLGTSAVKSRPATLVCFGRKAHLRNATCGRVRLEVAKWTSASKATRSALRNECRASRAANCRRPYRRGICVRDGRLDRTLTQRAKWFDSRIKSTKKEYS